MLDQALLLNVLVVRVILHIFYIEYSVLKFLEAQPTISISTKLFLICLLKTCVNYRTIFNCPC